MPFMGRILSINMKGEDVRRLHEVLLRLGYNIPHDEAEKKLFGSQTKKAVVEFQANNNLEKSGIIDEATADLLNRLIAEQATSFSIAGTVVSPFRPGIDKLRVELVDKNVGGDRHIKDAITDAAGEFNMVLEPGDLKKLHKRRPDLQVKVFAGKKLLGVSEVCYNATPPVNLNVTLTEEASAALLSEHETLSGELSVYYKGSLRDLKENEEQSDITYLANKTGWDARAVALAALADGFSHESGKEKIPSVAFYALFRAGLPAEEETLYHNDAATLKVVWERAAQQGVIPQDAIKQITTWVKQFGMLSKEKLLTNPALVGVSSLKDMLAASGLNENQQDKFAELYAAHRSNMPAFWKAVADTLGGEVADRLNVDGKLGFLTINNAPLMQKLHGVAQMEKQGKSIKDPVQLAQWGYHRAKKWKEMLDEDKRISVPDEIPGDSSEEKRKNYSDYLAAQVRLSYPTASVAEMIKTDKLLGKVSDQVHAFLSKHQGEFQIGVQPIEQFIKRNKINDAPKAVVGQLKRLQRVYQITPSDQAMTGLLKHNVDAAYHIVRKQKQEFIRVYGKDMGGDDQAALTYDKAVQVHNAVLNIAVSFLTASNAPGIGVHSPGQNINPTPTPPANADDVIAYSTLENLFGEMDYCACDHCRSILSPAAYLVDLLQFIDTSSPESNKENPQNVLFQRRPDIQYLPLTCENTNTALPYIDVLNETLEYFVANQVNNNKLSLDGYKGYDTSGITTEDLLASPQYVNTTAYTVLRDARFPVQLPFHQPLEYLRRYFGKFEVPLPMALERLRASDDLERPNPADPSNPVEYGWRDILLEEIGMSRIDNDILTTATDEPNVLWQIYGYPIGTQDQDIINGKAGNNIVALSNAKHFTRRIGITYEDIVAILRTRFVNPNSNLIPKLERLGIPFTELKKLKDGNSAAADAAFDALLPAGPAAPDPAKYGGDIKAWVKNNDNYSRIMSLITLMDPTTYWAANKSYNVGDLVRPSSANVTSSLFYYECTTAGTSGGVEPTPWPTTTGNTVNDGTAIWTCRQGSSECNFGILEFRHTDPTTNSRLTAVEFVRLLRFIRLWKKIDWTIEQTDAAICALYNDDMSPIETDDLDDLIKLNNGFLRLLPRLGVVMRVMKALGLTSKRDLLPLLACFAPIDTHDGMEWFLDKDGSRRPRIVPSLYRQMFLNPVILNQDSIFSDNYGSYLGGSEVLSDHTESLRSAFKLTGDELEVIIDDLPVDPNLIDRDQNNNLLLTLRNISAIFRRGWLARKLKLSVRELLLLTKLTGLAPFTLATLTDSTVMRFITLVQAMRDRKLKTESALYLVWNQDLSGKSASSMESVGAFGRSLRLGLSAIESEFSIKDDPDGAIAQTRMALVYGSDAAAFFFGLLNDTFSVQVEFTDPDGTLDTAAVRQAIENASGTTDAGTPKLAYDSFRKKLSYSGVLSAQKQNDIKQAAGVGTDKDKFKAAIDKLYVKSQEATSSFFARYPELQLPYNIYVGSNDPAAIKRGNLLAAMLPVLITQRKTQQTLQAVSAVAQTNLDMVKALLDTSPGGIALHAAGQVNQPALNDLLALQTEGLTVKFFASDTASGAVLPADDVAANLNYAPLVNGIGNSLPTNPTPNAAISGIWMGFVEAPATGFFKIRIEADLGAKVTLVLNGTGINLTQSATLHENTNPLELRAGILYLIELKIEKVRNIVRVQWDWEPKGQGRTIIPSRYLYPIIQFEAFRGAYIRFLKAASLAEELGFTANEIAYFATNADYVINTDKWLNALPVIGNAANPVALLKPLQALLDYARIKADYAPDDERLLETLKDPVAATADANSLLFTLTRWDAASLDALLVHFGKIISGNANHAALKDLNTFVRVHNAILLTRKMGISADTLIGATMNEPNADSVRALQAALCARYDSAGWRDLVRPINDVMRGLQRDALVAYVLHQMRSFPASQHIDTPEKLFEYFLMDVQMEPCMLTSRIRHALSSVQLFIERCLMNLEPHVSPAAIDSKQWEWRKRYRVWEANRKVFLYPENWLEPELRDDKSPFFKEIESELLQSDITEDSAATALLNYLSKLEEVAKLEPCGIYNDEDKDIDHVVARTAGANRKYYYRRREGRTWTPWEQIKLDIEDNPVIPVVWQGRLLLSWLRILKQQPDAGTQPAGSQVLFSGMTVSSMISTDATKVSIRAVLCWSEYYNGKWQSTKTSDIDQPTDLGLHDPSGLFAFKRSRLKLGGVPNGDDLRVFITGNVYSKFLLFNTHSLPLRNEDPQPAYVEGYVPRRLLWTVNNELSIGYFKEFDEDFPSLIRQVLKSQDNHRLIEQQKQLHKAWDASFFFEDSHHVFYVTTKKEPKWIDDHSGYGILTVSSNLPWLEVPQLVLKTIRIKEVRSRKWKEGGPIDPRPGFVDPVPIRQFISEDAYIHRGIGVTGNVKYGDRQIGLFGVVPNSRVKS